MTNGFEPTTDREIMLSLSNKLDLQNERLDNFGKAIERFSETMEKLEVGKVGDLEKRINTVEKAISEGKGGIKLMGFILTILSIASIIISLRHG